MIGWPILSMLIVLPLCGVCALTLINDQGEQGQQRMHRVGLAFSLATAVLALVLPIALVRGQGGFQFEERASWIPQLGISWHLGLDGISVWLVVLAALLVPLAMIASRESITGRAREFMLALLVLQSLLIGAFSALDMVMFYLFYEGALLPLFVLIGTWGAENRTRAAFNFVLFNMVGSVFLLIAIIVIGVQGGTFDIPTLMASPVSPQLQTWLWLAMFVSFTIKMPMWPVHTWLPEVHVQAPTSVSMLIAGVHMKLGTYGFMRLLLPLLPDASDLFAPLVMTLGAVTVVQCSLVAFTQTHLKRVLAYATMAHMGFTAIAVFSRSIQSIEGCILMVFIQGLVSACLFMCAGSLYHRVHTYETHKIVGVIRSMPRFSFVFLMLILGAVGLPGTGNFLGELLILIGTFHSSPIIAIAAGTAIVLGPVYLLTTYHKITFTPSTETTPLQILDMPNNQLAATVGVLVLMVWLGLHPPAFISATTDSVTRLVAAAKFSDNSRVLIATGSTLEAGWQK